jgi:hypothetical protein
MCALFSEHVRVVPANARNVRTNVRHVRNNVRHVRTNVRHVRRNAYITCTVRVRYGTVRRKSFPNVRLGKALRITYIYVLYVGLSLPMRMFAYSYTAAIEGWAVVLFSVPQD